MSEYVSNRKDLMSEWDFDKNTELQPDKIVCSSKVKVWWKCKEGHSWKAMISNRARLGRSCPYCSHQLPIKGETDLLTLYPEICSELHPTKNGNIDPSMTMPGTHKEAWFICPKCGSDYKIRIYHRVKGMGCPVCAGKRVAKGINDFGTKYPNLLKEWDFNKNADVSPFEIVPSSDLNVWWTCPIGHEYRASVSSRVNGKHCPVCQKTHRTSFPEQAILYYVRKYFPDAINNYKEIFSRSMELDVFIPSINAGIEYDGKAWHSKTINLERDRKKYEICKKHNIFLIRVREEQYKDPIESCDLLLVLEDLKNVNYLNREIYHVLKAITSLSPKYFELYIGLNKQAQKNLFHFNLELMDVDVERDRRKIQSYLGEFEESLAKYRPDLVDEWDFEKNKPLTPYNVKPLSNEKVWWKCHICGKEWRAAISERAGHDKTNCPECAKEIGGRKHHDFVLKQKDSLAITHPHLLNKWDYSSNTISPYDVVAGSGENVWWKCQKCGYSWKTSINHMATRNSGCPACLNKVCVPGYNDVATKCPDLMLDWDKTKNVEDPSKITTAGRRAFWKCHICGYEWSALIASRVKGVGCPKCAIERRKGNKYALKK